MPRVKLVVTDGYGTHPNPTTGQHLIDVGHILLANQHVREVVTCDFEPEANGDVRVSEGRDPVIVIEHVNSLIGKLLTVTDAMARDAAQRKAVKDLITQAVWQWYEGQGRSEFHGFKTHSRIDGVVHTDEARTDQ